MDIQLLAAKVARKIRDEGAWRTLKKGCSYLAHRAAPDEFDIRNGTDTSGVEPLWKFKIASPNRGFGKWYEPTAEQELAEAIQALHDAPRDLVFVDLGCGKGRTLLVAAKLGFKQVIGVEFAPELAEIATKNLAKMEIANGTILQADAADYKFPESDMVVYLYNPFSVEVMAKVIANLGKARSHKRYVIYKTPHCSETLNSCGFLSRLASPAARPYIQIWKSLECSDRMPQ